MTTQLQVGQCTPAELPAADLAVVEAELALCATPQQRVVLLQQIVALWQKRMQEDQAAAKLGRRSPLDINMLRTCPHN